MNYFISTTGDDTAAGDSAHPWKTIQRSVTAMAAGDVITVLAGSYAGFVIGYDEIVSGTALKPIVFQASGAVIINTKNSKTPTGIQIEPNCDYITVKGFTIQGSTTTNGVAVYPGVNGYGIRCNGNFNQIINNVVKDLDYAVAGIATNAGNNITVKGNKVSNTNGHGTGGMGHGMYIANSTGTNVQNNELSNNESIGLHINGDPNVVTNSIIENNLIYNNGQNAINADGLQNSIIRNNVIYGFMRNGICLYQIDASGPGKNNKIINNTIVSTVSSASAAVRIVSASTGNVVRNNILLGGGNIALAMSNDSLPGLVSDYNVVSSLFQSDDSGATQSLASWKSSSKEDAHSLLATSAQLFISSTDYHLKPGSPAIDAGNSVDAPTTDYDGNPRPTTGIDIGAFESSGGSPTVGKIVLSANPTVTANVPFNLTVSNKNADGTPNTTFVGTVHFSSTDTQAVLPADYKFFTSNLGTKVFSVTLKNSATISVNDTANPSVIGSINLTINSTTPVLDHFNIVVPAKIVTGTPFDVTVSVQDSSNNTVPGYTGTIHFG